jgi:predicted ABC-type ATPase
MRGRSPRRLLGSAGAPGRGCFTRIGFVVNDRRYRPRLLRSPDVAVERIRARVAAGGHDVPEDTICRRFRRSIINLFDLYLPIVNSWAVLDNSGQAGPTLIASGGTNADIIIEDSTLWSALEQCRHER